MQSDDCKAVYISCDITDEESVRKCAQNIANSFGTVNGVIHCAGIFRNNFIINKNAEEFDTVLAPKVRGTRLLHQYFGGNGLKFFLYHLWPLSLARQARVITPMQTGSLICLSEPSQPKTAAADMLPSIILTGKTWE